jgi:hypothetical protein
LTSSGSSWVNFPPSWGMSRRSTNHWYNRFRTWNWASNFRTCHWASIVSSRRGHNNHYSKMITADNRNK